VNSKGSGLMFFSYEYYRIVPGDIVPYDTLLCTFFITTCRLYTLKTIIVWQGLVLCVTHKTCCFVGECRLDATFSDTHRDLRKRPCPCGTAATERQVDGAVGVRGMKE